MVRSGMTDLIVRLRGMIQAGTADYSIAGTNYWSDDQLQSALDRNSTPVRIRMSEVPENIGGIIEYHDYLWGENEVERAGSGTAVWRVVDAGGTIQGTGTYSINYDQKKIRFFNEKLPPMYLESTAFDLNAAAAQIWREKAGHYAARFDVSTDNHNLRRSQLMTHAERMAKHFERMTTPKMVTMQRSDSRW